MPVLNAFYIHLLEAGRVKADGNSRMYEYWRDHRTLRDGLGPIPTELSKACGTSYQAAVKEAVCRYRRGRVPEEYLAGLSPKSVRNIHRLLHRALSDAVAWDYLIFNPAEHAIVPRERRRGRNTAQPWSVDELAQWLRCAQQDRFAGMWVLAATTGMRRSELLGVRRDSLDLDTGTLTIDGTLISVGGRPEESDGKTAAGVRTVSLDAFTIASLQQHLAMLDVEQQAFGPAYPHDGWLFVWQNGQRPHPDTVKDRFTSSSMRPAPGGSGFTTCGIPTQRCPSTAASIPKSSVIESATPTRRSHSRSTPIEQPDGTAPPRNSSAS